MDVSVVIPVYNEAENIQRMYDALQAVLPGMNREFEIVFVDDGSTDKSLSELWRLARDDRQVKVIELRHNFGQTAAMSAGIEHARGDVIVTMDGDLQNDPTDIPLMLEKIDQGYDLVHGWRKNRQDAFINRKLPSVIANRLISVVTGFPVHDLGCTLKAIRREVANELELCGEMHRFIPILARRRGARCVEVVTKHHARQFGKSKYGISRVFKVLLDLITVKYLIRYMASPMRLFGTIGLCCAALGMVSGGTTVYMKLASQTDMTGNPLLLLSVLCIMLSVQFFGMGMLGEVGSRIYFQDRGRSLFAVRSTQNIVGDEESATRQPLPKIYRGDDPEREAA